MLSHPLSGHNMNSPSGMYSQTGGLVPPPPPAFLFVVDTCVTEEDLEGLRNALKQLLELMPQTALVGLISYGTMVQVRILSANCPYTVLFVLPYEIKLQKSGTYLLG